MRNLELSWNLRTLMFENGMHQTTDLIGPLGERGVHLSREQVFRLVTRAPQRLNVAALVALCEIFGCEPNDLLVLNEVAVPSTLKKTGTEETQPPILGIRPVRANIKHPNFGL